MTPFVLLTSERRYLAPVCTEESGAQDRRVRPFLEERGIPLPEAGLHGTWTKETVTKSTQTGEPPNDSDENTYEQPDHEMDPDDK